MTHKSEDYKISAVKYYLKNKDNIRKTCKIFDCKKSTLQRWIQRYNSTKNLTRRNRKSISYKISKPQVNTALDLLKQNEQLTMNELLVDMKNKYSTFDITPQHLGQIVRDKVVLLSFYYIYLYLYTFSHLKRPFLYNENYIKINYRIIYDLFFLWSKNIKF